MCNPCPMTSEQQHAQPELAPSACDQSSTHSLSALVARTRVQQNSQSLFQLERSKLLRINLQPEKDDYVWLKRGSIVRSLLRKRLHSRQQD